jgi:hypothetical protein
MSEMPELVWAYDTAMQGASLVVIREYGSRVEADLAKCTLEDAGIEAMSQADTAGGIGERLARSGAGFKILVREEDAAVACELLTKPAEGDTSKLTPSFDILVSDRVGSSEAEHPCHCLSDQCVIGS